MEAPRDNHEDANAAKKGRGRTKCDSDKSPSRSGFLPRNEISVQVRYIAAGGAEHLGKSAVPCFPGCVLAAKFRAPVIRCSRAN